VVGASIRTGAGSVVEVVELLFDASGIGVTALLPVQLQRFPPCSASLLVAFQGVVSRVVATSVVLSRARNRERACS